MYVCMWMCLCLYVCMSEWMIECLWLCLCFSFFFSFTLFVCLCSSECVCVFVRSYETVPRLVRTLCYTVRMHRMKSCLETAIRTHIVFFFFSHIHTLTPIHANDIRKSPHAKQIAKNIIIDSKTISLILYFFRCNNTW